MESSLRAHATCVDDAAREELGRAMGTNLHFVNIIIIINIIILILIVLIIIIVILIIILIIHVYVVMFMFSSRFII